MPTEIITTQRLCLRTPINSDLETLHEQVFSDAQVMRFVFAGIPLSLEQSSAFVASAFDHEATGLKLGVLIEKDSSDIVGFSGLLPCNALNEEDYEIGFVLSQAYWGKGYATEIGYGQLDYGFNTVGCKRLLAQVDPGNTRSISVLDKIGMVFHKDVFTEGRGLRKIYVAYSKLEV